MLTPVPNEPSCSQAACHAHPAATRTLGVLDLSLNLDSVDREVAGMKLRVLAVTAVEIALISLFIVYFTRRFLGRPIGKLIEGTKAVSQMNLDQPIDIVNSSEELDELARSFDAMRDRLRAALGELNQFTQNLESKVEERTAQLQAAQRKLVQTGRLASLGQLAASVAHEINNPVSGVLNLSMLLSRMLKEDGVPPGRLEEFRKYLSQIVAESGRVGRIVSDLLAFSRRSQPQRVPADLNGIVRTTLSLAEHKMKLSNVEVESRLAENLPQAPCDPSQIQQVVLNLLLNAAEATEGRSGDGSGAGRSSADRLGQRRRHPPGEPGQDLRPVLHHQIGREGRGPRPGGLIRYHASTRGRYRGQEPDRRGDSVRGFAAARAAAAGWRDRDATGWASAMTTGPRGIPRSGLRSEPQPGTLRAGRRWFRRPVAARGWGVKV
jgi:two-component system NtrC family sensor kinase